MRDEKFCFEEFVVDPLKRTVSKGPAVVGLTPRAFDLLLAFVTHSGVEISKQELLDIVWEGRFVEEKNLTVHVAALRKALGEGKGEHRFIVTVPGIGYKFVSDVNVAFKPQDVSTDEIGIKSNTEQPVRAAAPAGSVHGRSFRVAGLILSVAVVVLAVGYSLRLVRKTSVPASPFTKGFSIRRLTTDGKATSGAISPDGKLYVYSHLDGERQSLWLGHVDGGTAIQLRPPALVTYFSVRFTPDASNIYFAATDEKGDTGDYRIPVFGGSPERIEDKGYIIAFSPDGRRMAFVKFDPAHQSSTLNVSDADGTNESVLSLPPENAAFVGQGIAWSKDSQSIAVTISRNGTGKNLDLSIVDVNTGSVRPLTDQIWSGINSVVWMGDGSGLVIIGQRSDSIRKQIWYVSFPSGEVEPLTSDLNLYGSSITKSDDERSMLTVQEQTQSNIWVSESENLAKATQITNSSLGRMDGWYGVEYSPDGHLVYTADVDGNNTIWMMKTDGSDQKQIIPSEGDNLYPSLTSDGRTLVFQSNRRGNYAVWRANIDGSDLRPITDAGIAAQPDISADGKWVVYVSSPDGPGELWRLPANGGEPVKLAERASWPRISPDGSLVACGYETDGTKVAIIPIAGGEPVKVFDIPRLANLRLGVRWTPDGRSVTYRDWANGIWQQSINGGEPKRLKGLPKEKLYAYNWSIDGKWFAYTRGTEYRDIVLLNRSN